MEKTPEQRSYNKELFDEYYKRFDIVFKKAFESGKMTDFINEIGKKGAELRAKYGHKEVEDRALFHVLASSTMGEGVGRDDFEGEDSIASFIEHLEEKYGK